MTAQHAKPSVIIGIPCYNEADRLAVETLVAFQPPGQTLSRPYPRLFGDVHGVWQGRALRMHVSMLGPDLQLSAR